MLDGIGKDLCFPFAIFLHVLLTAQHNGLRTIKFVDTVDDGIKFAHFLELFGIRIKQVLLNGTIWPNSHDNDTSFFVMVALTIELLKNFVGCLYYGDGAAGWGDEPHFLKVPVLWQVFTEDIGIEEHSHNRCDCALLT